MARIRRFLGLIAAVACVISAPVAVAEEETTDPTAVLQALDKVTARVSELDAVIGQPARFGTLEIVARTCHKAPPEEPPESAAFLEISERRPNQAPRRLFTGWMFASSPALSALEHPVYDIWVLDCRAGSAPDPDAGNSEG